MKKKIPILNFSINKERDIAEILQFVQEDDQYILDTFPDFKDVSKEKLKKIVPEIITKTYIKNEAQIKEKINFLENKKDLLMQSMRRMSDICEEDWTGIESLDIFVGVNPIAPRNLQEKYFMIPVYETNDSLLSFCIHELIHFIYFKKWQVVFGDSYESYEYPHKNWVLSEILAPIILSDKKLRDLVFSKTALYPHWQKFDKKYELIKIFSENFEKRKNFKDFLEKSKEEYDKLDRKFELTRLLTT